MAICLPLPHPVGRATSLKSWHLEAPAGLELVGLGCSRVHVGPGVGGSPSLLWCPGTLGEGLSLPLVSCVTSGQLLHLSELLPRSCLWECPPSFLHDGPQCAHGDSCPQKARPYNK